MAQNAPFRASGNRDHFRRRTVGGHRMISVGLVVVRWTWAEPARFGPVADRLRQTFRVA